MPNDTTLDPAQAPAAPVEDQSAQPVGTNRPSRITMFALAIVLEVFIVLWAMIQTVAQSNPRQAWLFGAALTGALGVFAVYQRKKFIELFASIRGLLVLLAFITLATIVGTLVLQGERPEAYSFSYGAAGYQIIRFFHLNDLYHALWFKGLLMLLFLNLLVVTIHRKPIKRRLWGFMVTHIAVMTIMAGGIGALFAKKGWIDLREGQTVSQTRLTEGNTMDFSGEVAPLGFDLTLEDFQLEEYEKQFKIYAYTRKPGVPMSQEGNYANKDFYKPFARPVTGPGTITFPGLPYAIEVTETYPDYSFETEILDDPQSGENPAAEVLVYSRASPHAAPTPQWVDRFNPVLPDTAGSNAVMLSWGIPEEGFEKSVLHPGDSKMPPQGEITLIYKSDGGTDQFAVEEGKSYDIMGYDLRLNIERYVPHFGFNSDTNEVFSQSDEPRNPAVKVSLNRISDQGQGTGTWLFAFFPEMNDPHKKLPPLFDFEYRSPAQEEFKTYYVIVAAAKEIWKIQDHKVVEKIALEGRIGPGSVVVDTGEFKFGVARMYGHAKVKRSLKTLSEKFTNPVIAYRVLKDGKPLKDRFDMEEIYVAGAQPEAHFFDQDQFVVEYANKIGEKKNFRSVLVVTQNGQEKMRHAAEVNRPLYFKPTPWWRFWEPGWYVYQSNFNPDDLTYSGFRTTRDWGLNVIYFGFVLMIVGIIWMFYFPDRKAKR